MKQIVNYLIAISLVACGEPTKQPKNEVEDNTPALIVTNENPSLVKEEQKNSESEEVFREIYELTGFEKYDLGSGSLIDRKYCIGLYHNKENKNQHLLAFEKIVYHEDGKAKYKLLDTLTINNLDRHPCIAFHCRIREKGDREIVAIYQHEDNVEYHKIIIKAWRMNRETLKIEEIDITAIDCINEGYGV